MVEALVTDALCALVAALRPERPSAVRHERRADILDAFHRLAAALIRPRFVVRWSCRPTAALAAVPDGDARRLRRLAPSASPRRPISGYG